MYAVIETGGKQYRVELGTEVAVERLEGEPGATVTFDRVLLVADGDDATIGRPLVAEAAVAAEVVAQDRADKVIVFKYRPKARRRVKKGHRQERTVLRISDIRFNGRSAADDARQADEARKTERERLQEAAAKQAAEDAALAAKLAGRTEAKASTTDEGTKTTRKGRSRGAATTESTADASTARKPARGRGSTKPAAAGEAETTETTPTETTATAPTEGAEAPSEAAPKRGRTKKDQ